MTMRIVIILASYLVCAVAGELAALPPVAAVVDARVQRFEQAVDAAFSPVRNQLVAWREKQARSAMAEAAALLATSGPGDRAYLAYHLLSADPKHKAARKVYADLGLPPPFDELGVRAAGVATPACETELAVAKACELAHPRFEAVAKAIDLRGSTAAPFWRKLESEQDALRKDLVKIAADRSAEQAAQSVYPLLVYYQPSAAEAFYAASGKPIPSQREWFNPVDRWLLASELAGIDALRPVSPSRPGKVAVAAWSGSGGGDLPALLPGAAVEITGAWTPGARVQLTGPRGAGVAWTWTPGRMAISALGFVDVKPVQIDLAVDLAAVTMPVQCEVRGSRARFAVGGIEVATLVLPQAVAVKQWKVKGIDRPLLLRVRFLAGEALSIVAAPMPQVVKPAWTEDRERQLAATVSCDFADVSLSEVAVTLSRITGTTFRIAPSAEPLSDLPISLSARGVPLKTVLEWLRRLAEIDTVAEEAGFRCEWKRL